MQIYALPFFMLCLWLKGNSRLQASLLITGSAEDINNFYPDGYWVEIAVPLI